MKAEYVHLRGVAELRFANAYLQLAPHSQPIGFVRLSEHGCVRRHDYGYTYKSDIAFQEGKERSPVILVIPLHHSGGYYVPALAEEPEVNPPTANEAWPL